RSLLPCTDSDYRRPDRGPNPHLAEAAPPRRGRWTAARDRPGSSAASDDDGPADDSDEAGQSDRDEGADDEPLPRHGRGFDLGEAAESLDRDDHGHEFGASEDDGSGDEGAFDDADPHAAAQHLDVLAAGALGPAARPRVRQRQE